MRTDVPDGAFQPAGRGDQFFHFIGRVVNGAQVRNRLQRFADRLVFPLNRRGNQLGHPVHFRQRNIHHTAYIADGAAGGNLAKCDNLGYLICTILLVAVVHHFGTAVVLEIQINIGHGDAVGVQEALEEQVVIQGVHRSDLQSEGHHRTVAGAAHVIPNAVLTAEMAEVPNDEEVLIEAHIVDDFKLVLQALLYLRLLSRFRDPAQQTLLTEFLEVACRFVFPGDLELGQVIAFAAEVHVAAFCDGKRIRNRLGKVAE